jgi:hypothetical protein
MHDRALTEWGGHWSSFAHRWSFRLAAPCRRDHAVTAAGLKPPKGRSRRRSAIAPVAAITASLLCNSSVGAKPSSCGRALSTTDITIIKSFLHLRNVARGPEDRQCAAYREHVATVEKVREVFERCLSGKEREIDLRELGGAIDDANGMIARVCER